MMTKAAIYLSTARNTIEATVAEMDLSLINYEIIVNKRLKNTHSVLIN